MAAAPGRRAAGAGHIVSRTAHAAKRRYAVVLYGATGFVGRQTVAYFAAHAELGASGLRWALAGRNADKLEQVRAACAAEQQADILIASADDHAALDALARSAAVVLSTAGPFDLYGSALVAACVKHGTHYVDITGETPWVQGLITRHHATAASSGTRIVPFCGFDSVPSDLGAWLLMQAMQQRHGVSCVDIKAAFTVRGGLNGGTMASVLNILGSAQAAAFADPFLLSPPTRRPTDVSRHADPTRPRLDADFKAWLAPFFMGPINTRVVRRSAALLGYGDAFHYQEYLRLGAGPLAAAAAASLSLSMGVGQRAMAWSGVRALAATLAPKPGEGPSEAAMDGGSFRCELVGTSATGQQLRGRIAARGDPGNRATTKMVCESALCLALEPSALPAGPGFGGVLTPASAFGVVLVERLRRAGMTLVVDA
ncbi:MAG: saccharopine dehydrogenase NADP-binding domain-containing protein [Rhodoferax sp.]|nr:saccharopine dehydrogenase NADP-binding domain-containing protein [Rhodoferax sp.]